MAEIEKPTMSRYYQKSYIMKKLDFFELMKVRGGVKQTDLTDILDGGCKKKCCKRKCCKTAA
jgi:hypothetical protein